MLRTSVTLFAAFGLLAACASSSANQPNSNNPDAGKVDYDVGQPSGGGDGGGDAPASDGGDAGPTVKGRDSTTTRGNTAGPKVVKRVATTKPPKPEEPAPTEPAKKPSRKGRVDPNGLLGEAFTIPATTDKVPEDFAALGAPRKLFIASTVASSESAPVPGLPAAVTAPLALRFTGSLNVTEAAEYKLCTSSVDGSQLLLESTVVVDNDGLKKDGAAEVCEIVALDPGEYGLEVRSFHVTGPVIVNLTWAKGKDGTPEAIPTKSLFKPTGADDRVKAGK